MDLAIDQTGHRSRWSLDGGLAGFGLQPVTHIAAQQQLLAGRRMGRVVIENGRLKAVYGRWWPHAGNLLQIFWDLHVGTRKCNRCELFFHEPLTALGFLTLSYVHSGPQTSIGTLYAAGLVLDEIAKIKCSKAIVCNVSNQRISERALQRWGWEPHCQHWSGRHFIKRFYGEYTEIRSPWRTRLTLD